jgi:hypothetical protein
MARTVRNGKLVGPKGGVWLARLIEPGRRHETTLSPADDALDTRSARAKLPANKSGYWVPITRGFAVGYRKGSNPLGDANKNNILCDMAASRVPVVSRLAACRT